MTVRSLLGTTLLFSIGCGNPATKPSPAALVVLGIDGMDPVLTRTYLEESRLPHLGELARNGSFIELGTSNPPQSPVAWSHFITGTSSAAHGIYDFVHRDPLLMSPYLSTSRVKPATLALSAFGWRFPLGSAEMKLLREGEPFWSRLTAAGIPATVLKIPAHFPPTEAPGGRTLSGMGTPDLLGTYGTFQFLTDDPAFLTRRLGGGMVQPLQREGASLVSVVHGPANPMRTDEPPLTIPVRIRANAARTAALCRSAMRSGCCAWPSGRNGSRSPSTRGRSVRRSRAWFGSTSSHWRPTPGFTSPPSTSTRKIRP